MTMRWVLLLCIGLTLPAPLPARAPENPGPHAAGWTTTTISRSGRSLACRIYYPALTEGADAPFDTTAPPAPLVAFGHGFFMQTGYYLSLFRHLATHGFVLIAPQFPDVDHGELADDLLFCIEHLRTQHSTTGSRFAGRLDTARIGLSGHSMGGGASLLAAARDARVAVVAPLAAAETNPSAIAAMPLIRGVPFLIAGASDGITPPADHQIPMYNGGLPLKGLLLILQANHTRFMDVSTFDWTDPNGTLTRPEQLRITRRSLTGVLRLVLRGDTDSWIYAFGDSALSDPAVLLRRALRPLVPLPFAQIGPEGPVADPHVTFRWRRASALDPSQAVRYRIAFQPLFPSPDPPFEIGPLNDTTWTAATPLHRSTRYRWRVYAATSDSTERPSNGAMDMTVLCRPPARRAHILITNAVGESDTLWFGYDSLATCGEDAELCEMAVAEPCGPPGDWFCVFWREWCNPAQSALLIHDYRALSFAAAADTHEVGIQAGPNGYPVVLRWRSEEVRAMCDSAVLSDLLGGGVHRVRMDILDSLVITGSALSRLRVIRYGQRNGFSDCTEPALRSRIAFEDPAGGRDTLWWALGQGATCGLDTALCEGGREEPPPPPAGVFDVRFTGGTCTTGTHRAYLPRSYDRVDTIRIGIQPGAAGIPVTVRWTSTSWFVDSLFLQDIFGGILLRWNLRDPGQGLITNPAITGLHLLIFHSPLGVEDPGVIPAAPHLYQNYPNPFNPVTTIRYAIPSRYGRVGTSRLGGTVSLQVFDVLGRWVATLLDTWMPPGMHTVTFDGTGLAGGVYLCRLTAGDRTLVRRMLLLK